jgi:hypothetical protein
MEVTMTDDTSDKPRIYDKSDPARRQEARVLRVESRKCSNKQADDTTALTVPALLARADGTVFEPNYLGFLKGHSAAACGAKFDPRGNAQWVKKAEKFLYAISRWPGPVAIPLRHRIRVCRLCRKLNDSKETS